MNRYILNFAVVGIICLIMLQVGNKPIVASETYELEKLVSIIQGENILIKEWSLHSREKLEKINSTEDLEQYIFTLKKQFPQWQWSVSEEGQHWKTTGFSSQDNVNEKITVVTTLKKHINDAYVIYEVKGKAWNSDAQDFLQNEFSSKLVDIFQRNTTIFSCIEGEFNDKMEKTLNQQMDGLLRAFDAQQVEALNEENFISVSAKSPQFSTSIQSEKDMINLQLGLRTQGLGGKTTLVVGTPIITIEY